jgi:hypothetical protein
MMSSLNDHDGRFTCDHVTEFDSQSDQSNILDGHFPVLPLLILASQINSTKMGSDAGYTTTSVPAVSTNSHPSLALLL